VSLERVWRISKLTPNSFLLSKKSKFKKMKTYEFGESLENLQTHSKLIPLFPKNKSKIEKNKTEKMKTYEFGESLENLQTHSKLIPLFQKKKVK